MQAVSRETVAKVNCVQRKMKKDEKSSCIMLQKSSVLLVLKATQTKCSLLS